MQELWKQWCDCYTVGNHRDTPVFSSNEMEKDLFIMAQEHTYRPVYRTISLEINTKGWGRMMSPSDIIVVQTEHLN